MALPLAFNWSTGENERPTDPVGSKGFSPRWQLQRLLDGDPMLPTFEFYDPFSRNGTPDDSYYRELFQYAKERMLPINFVGRNLADSFRQNNWPTEPESSHPYLIDAEGTVTKLASPFGTIEAWREMGRRIAAELKPFHDDYPHCPRVILSDNAEVGEAGLALSDYRCPQRIKDLDSQSQRDVIARLYRTRYRACFAEIRKALPLWGDRIKFGAYSGSLGEFGISRYTKEPDRYSHPWNGPSGHPNDMLTRDILWTNTGYNYLNVKWNQVNCPQVRCENARYAWHQYEQETGVDRIRSVGFFDLTGPDTVEQWRGMVRACLWITKPEYVMHFDSSNTPAEGEELRQYEVVIEECRRLHDNPVLRDYWLNGELVENDWRDEREGNKYDQKNAGYGHPFQQMLPRDYRDPVTNRWHLLHVPLNQRTGVWGDFKETGDGRIIDRWNQHGSWDIKIKVHAFCSMKNDDGLLFVHSTGETYENVEVLVPDHGMVTVPVVPPQGKFWLLNSLTEIEVE